MKTVSVLWSLLVGLLSIIVEVLAFYVRFGDWNMQSPFIDYFFFFLTGTMGGWILVFFLNRQTTVRARWIVLSAFLLACPIALTLMVLGGLFGWPGVFFLPQIPWGLLTWAGSLTGKYVLKS